MSFPNSHNCQAYQVEALTADLKYSPYNFVSIFEYRAFRFHVATSKIYTKEQPDIIEFFEYAGIAYHALIAKIAGLDYQKTHLTIRLHGSLELIDRQQPGNIHGIDRYIMYALEHQALRLAESVLYPSITYLERAYQPYYETWFGKSFFSKPPLVDKPELAATEANPDIILFFSRLHGIKGVDIFVDAAILYLSNPENPRRRFYLVGYDSFTPPGLKGSYQVYLRSKIPPQLQDFFQFTGHLSWQELGKILPQVLCAVIPSYSESFCYAAHELYEVGIPMIVSDIPAFQDYFQHEKNALVFDGTVSDLATQITRLSTDMELRQRIKRPYSISQKPLGDFYSLSLHPSWITNDETTDLPSLLICVLCGRPEKLDITLQSIKTVPSDQVKYVLVRPRHKDQTGENLAWFLGQLSIFEDETGKQIQPTQVFTSETLLILKAGDTLDTRFVHLGLSTLRRQTQISFVGSWRCWEQEYHTQIETLPLDAALELSLFMPTSLFSRFIMRTSPGKLLIDLFESRAGRLGEMDYLWRSISNSTCGITIPEPLITRTDENETVLDSNEVDFLIIRDDDIWRKRRLSRFLLCVRNRSGTLQDHLFVEGFDQYGYKPSMLILILRNWVYWLSNSRLNQWISKAPRLKQAIRKVVFSLLEF